MFQAIRARRGRGGGGESAKSVLSRNSSPNESSKHLQVALQGQRPKKADCLINNVRFSFCQCCNVESRTM